jgi:hypothetical protein
MIVNELIENELLKKQVSDLGFELNNEIFESAIHLNNGASLLSIAIKNDEVLAPGEIGLFVFCMSNSHSDQLCFIDHVNARLVRNNPSHYEYDVVFDHDYRNENSIPTKQQMLNEMALKKKEKPNIQNHNAYTINQTFVLSRRRL